MHTFNYQELTDHFNASLLTTLRAHTAASDLFEFWVPDADIVQSIINMVDNFDFDATSGFRLLVQKEDLNYTQITEIENMLMTEINLRVETENDFTALTFTNE